MPTSRNAEVFKRIQEEYALATDEVMQKIATVCKQYWVEMFDIASGGGSTEVNNNESWTPLQPETIKYKERHGSYGDAMLKTTGALYEALNQCDQNFERYGNQYVKGIKLIIENEYASYQNDGTDTIPARPFFELTDTLTERIKETIEEYFNSI